MNGDAMNDELPGDVEPLGPPSRWYRQLPTPAEHDAVLGKLTAAKADGDTLIESPPGLYVNNELWDRVI